MKNEKLENLIKELKKKSITEKVNIWKRIATDLEKPSRNRRVVNLYSINLNAKENEIVIIPGKLLGTGDLNKKITIAAYEISKQAEEKIKHSGSKIVTITELIEKNPKGNKVRILG
jgi:large subunit ribosomal protein L18e